MRWCFSFGWLCGVWNKSRKNRPIRRWFKYIQPRLEPLEDRRLLSNNVWLPQQLTPFDGTTQTNYVLTNLFQPATTSILPQLGLKGTSVAASGSLSLSDNGNYSLSLTQSGPYDGSGDRYAFSESGTVSFALTEAGTFSAAGFSINSYTLTQTATLSWSLVETNSSGQTVLNLSGTDTLNGIGNGTAAFDPFFSQGLNWLSLTQKISSLNTLGLANLTASALTVTETEGSESYVFQETNGVATVSGNAQQSLNGSLMQNGQQSYSETAVEQIKTNNQGSDSFSLTELGSYSGSSYALSSVSYQENGKSTYSSNPTVADTQSGTGTASGTQSFSGNNHALVDSSSESFQFNNLSTLSYGETATSNYALSLQGSYGGGSFNLNSMSYSANGSGNYSLTQTSLQTQNGTFSNSNNSSGTDSYGVAGSLGDSGTATQGGNYTSTSHNTLTDSESGNFTLTQQGGYGNGSWALSSYSLTESLSGTSSQQQLNTVTQSGSGTTTGSGAATDSYALGYGSNNTTSATQTSNSTDTTTYTFTLSSTDSSSQSGSSSYSLTMQGKLQGGVPSLSCYVFSASQSGASSDSSTSNQSSTGSSQQSISGSDGGNDCYGNGGINNNNLNGDTYSSSSGYSYTSTQSDSSSDSGSFSQNSYQAGVYNNGSFALSTANNTSTQSYSWSYNSSSGQTNNGNSTSTANATAQNNGTSAYGGGDFEALSNQTSIQTSTDCFTQTSVTTISETGSAHVTFIVDGHYGGYSFGYGSVLYQYSSSFNGTIQDAYTGTDNGTAIESTSSGGNQTGSGTFNVTAANIQVSTLQTTQETYTYSDTATSRDTYVVGDSASLYEQGSIGPSGWNLSSVNYQETYTSAFSLQQTDNARDTGTDSYTAVSTSNNNGTTSYGGGSFNGVGTVLGLSTGGDNFYDSYGQTLTQAGGSTWSMSEQGSFSGFSYSLPSVLYQGGQTFSETTTSAQTDSSTGTANDSSTIVSQGSGMGEYAASYNSGVDSITQTSTDNFNTGGSDVSSQTATATDCSSFYESGRYAGGSYNLSSVSCAETCVSSYSYAGGDTQTSSGAQAQISTYNGNGGIQLNSNVFNGIVLGGSTITQTAAQTDTDAYSGSGGDAWSSSQQGSYSNFSYGYNTVIYQSNDSATESSTETATNFSSGNEVDSSNTTNTLTGSIGNGLTRSGGEATLLSGDSDSMAISAQGTSIQSYTSTDSSNFYESGSYSFGSYSMSSVSYGESYSDSYGDSSADSSTQAGLQTGTTDINLVSGGTLNYAVASMSNSASQTITTTQTTTGTATIINSQTISGSGGDCYSLSEQGIYANYSYSLSSVVDGGMDTSTGVYQQNDSSNYAGTYNGNADADQGGGGGAGLGLNENSGSSSSNTLGTIAVSESNFSGVSLTESGSETSTWLQLGSYGGASYAYSINQTVTATDAFTQSGSSSATTTSTLTGSISASSNYSSSNGYGNLANTISGNESSSSNASVTYIVASTQNCLTTITGSDSSTQGEQGNYANYSYSFGTWTYSAASAGTQNGQETDTLAEVLTASGSTSLGGTQTTTSVFSSGGGYSHSLSTAVTSNSSSSNTGFIGTITVDDLNTSTEVDTYSDSLYEAGSLSNGSYAFSTTAYTELSTSSLTSTNSGNQTTTDYLSANQSSISAYSGPSYPDQYTATNQMLQTELDTVTGSNDNTTSSSSTYSVYQGGSYSSGVWGLGSFNMYQSSLTTQVIDSDVVTESYKSGTMSGTRYVDGKLVESDNSSVQADTDNSNPQSTTSVSGYALTEMGGMSSASSFSLSCLVYAQSLSSSGSWSDASTGTESFSGTNTANGTAPYSGVQTSGSSFQENSSSSGTITEEGTYNNGTFALSLASYVGSGSDSYNSSDSSTSGWSGSYSGQETTSDSSSGNGTYNLSGSGSFNNGSFSLSGYAMSGGASGSSSDSDDEDQNDNGASSSYSVAQQNQQVDSLYQSGTESHGYYSNSSYIYLDNANNSYTNDAQGPGYSSTDTWVQQSSASLYNGGVGDNSSSATYSSDTNGSSATLSNNGNANPNTNPNAAVVQFVALDGNLVPTAGAAPSSSSSTAVVSGPSGISAPVAVNSSLQQVSDGQGWLSSTQATATQLINPTVSQSIVSTNTSAGGGGVAGTNGQSLVMGITPLSVSTSAASGSNASGDSQNSSPLAMRVGNSGSSSSSGPFQLASFSVQAWNSLRPLFQTLVPWLGGPSGQMEQGVQGMLQIQLPQQAPGRTYTGDPFVDWVDGILYNSGASLSAGSAPLYGTYWDGMARSAQDALSTAIPYAIGGTYLVMGMYLVGPGAVLGYSTAASGALIGAGLTLGVNLAGGATPDMMAQSVGQAFFWGGASEIKGVGNAISAVNAMQSFKEGDALGGLLNTMNAFRMRGTCFAGDMLLLSQGGKKRADAIREGDLLWSRDEDYPDGPLILKRVLRVFERVARIWHLRLPGQVLRTTLEHPFWVENRQVWLPVGELQVGDVVRTDCGKLLAVDAIEDNGKCERVYNWEIEDYHTYFVSASEDAASVWAHNASCDAHHYVPRFMGSLVRLGSSILTKFKQIGHIAIHRALNHFLQPLGMAPSRANPGAQIIRNFSKTDRLKALVQFYKQYQDGIHFQGFLRELRQTIKMGLFR